MPNPSTRALLTAFLPLLGVYLLCILPFASAPCERDECDYLESSVQLAAGGAYTAGSSGVLWRGPGYPLVLVPFAWLHLPWAAAKLLNAAFLIAGVLYLYRALRLYVPHRPALLASYAFGLYPPNFRQLPFLLTESLAVFLVCGIIYHFCSSRWSPGSRHHYFVASLFLAYLALTKIFFGYVLLAALLLSLFALCFRAGAARVSATICLLALLMCSPYLVLTYSMTGRPFYWGSSGGLSLYWMSTPYAGEYGSWYSVRDVQANPELARHRPFFQGLEGLDEFTRDDVLRARAMENIRTHPFKYVENVFANMGRLLFSYPFSYTPQKLSTYFYLLPNMFLVVLLVLGIVPAVQRRQAVPREIIILMAFCAIAFLGSSLLSALARQFLPLVPILFLWLAYTRTHLMGTRTP